MPLTVERIEHAVKAANNISTVVTACDNCHGRNSCQHENGSYVYLATVDLCDCEECVPPIGMYDNSRCDYCTYLLEECKCLHAVTATVGWTGDKNTAYTEDTLGKKVEAAQTAAKNAIAALKSTGHFTEDYFDGYEAECNARAAKLTATPKERELVSANLMLTFARSDALFEIAQLGYFGGPKARKTCKLFTAMADSFTRSMEAHEQFISAIYIANGFLDEDSDE